MNDKQQYILLIALNVVGIGILVGIWFYYTSYQTPAPKSSLVLSPTPTKPAVRTEPQVDNWTQYSNNTYNFSIQIPAKWNIQDFSSQYPTGGTQIAFSPDMLPCNTCTYFYNGFFSVRIYNQKTSPEFYSAYQERVKNIGQNADYQSVTIAEKPAVMYANTVALENQGWVYEFSLDTHQGKDKVIDSKIFQRAVTSLQFTGVVFNK